MEAILKIKGLKSYYYSGQNVIPAVDGVDLDIYPGEIVGIVGESGCGKSTVVRSLMGLLDPVSSKREGGQAIYLGKDLFQMKEKELCRIRGKEISMIFQNPLSALDPVYTIGDQIVEIIRIHEKISKKEAWAKGCEMLGRMNLASPDNVMNSYPFQLSGGMRQRVGIAMGMTYQPKLLLADEPTSALDPISTSKIEDLAVELKSKYTIIMVTHNMQQAVRISDNTAFFLLGEMVEYGKSDQLFSMPQDKRTEDYITGRFG